MRDMLRVWVRATKDVRPPKKGGLKSKRYDDRPRQGSYKSDGHPVIDKMRSTRGTEGKLPGGTIRYHDELFDGIRKRRA